MREGVLRAVGVGPGAPDLLTARAINVLKTSPIILAPASPRNDYSIALAIAAPWINPDAEIIKLNFPMTRDKQKLDAAWSLAAEQAIAALATGRDCAFPILGDPLVYGTFGYLMREIAARRPEIRVEITPGITSFQAAAARAALVLCEGTENLTIISGVNEREKIRRRLAENDPAIILKTYRNFEDIKKALAESDRLDDAVLAARVERPGENFSPLKEIDETPPYLSMALCPPKRRR